MKKWKNIAKESPFLMCVIGTGILAGGIWVGSQFIEENKAEKEEFTVISTIDMELEEEEVEEAEKVEESIDEVEKVEETVRLPIEPQFTYYTPQEVDSPYYYDVGRIALTTDFDYVTVDDTYFDDAAFIGDSRTLGLFDYSGWQNADFFCDNGFCAYTWTLNGEVTHQNAGKKVNLETALQEKTYGKIYLMVGMNDCGYGDTQNFQDRLKQMLEMIESTQPNAIIYLMANLHLSEEKQAGDAVNNNVDINAKNVAIAECADGVNKFYLDYNDLFTDDNGYLRKELSFDGTHLYAQEYPAWTDFIKNHAVE